MSATGPVDEARLGLLLGDLRLPAIKSIWPRFAERADKEGWPAARFLAALAEHEVAERARRRIERHLAEARLPPGKTLDAFEFEAVPTISKAQVMALVAGDSWLDRGANLLLFGPPGAEATLAAWAPSRAGVAGAGASTAVERRADGVRAPHAFEIAGERHAWHLPFHLLSAVSIGSIAAGSLRSPCPASYGGGGDLPPGLCAAIASNTPNTERAAPGCEAAGRGCSDPAAGLEGPESCACPPGGGAASI